MLGVRPSLGGTQHRLRSRALGGRSSLRGRRLVMTNHPEASEFPLHVMHVVLSLDYGGLERVVLHLLRQAPQQYQRVSILCLERLGALADEAQALGATMYCANKAPGLKFETIKAVESILAEAKPDVVHTHQIGALFYAGP